MNKYSTFYFFAGLVVAILLVSWLKAWQNNKATLTLMRFGFSTAIGISVAIFYAPWILLSVIFVWLVADPAIRKLAVSAPSDYKDHINLKSIGIFISIFFLIFLKIFVLSP